MALDEDDDTDDDDDDDDEYDDDDDDDDDGDDGAGDDADDSIIMTVAPPKWSSHLQEDFPAFVESHVRKISSQSQPFYCIFFHLKSDSILSLEKSTDCWKQSLTYCVTMRSNKL